MTIKEPDDHLVDLWRVIRSIPPGSVSSYGDVGAALKYPTTGRIVGRWMANCPDGVPWWRVIAKSGNLPIGKIDPFLQMEQTQLLKDEGVEVVEGRVDLAAFRYIP